MDEPVAARGGRDASALATGSLLSGLLAYVFFALVTRALGAEAAAPVAVLWAWWSFAGAAVTFPLQHWIARQAVVDSGEAGIRRGLPRVAAAVAAAAVAAGLVAGLARERLFGADGLAFPALVAAVAVGAAVVGVVRGLLSARDRFAALGAALVVENAVRCLVAAGLMAADVEAPEAYGLALLVGYAASAAWPSALVPRRTGSPGTTRPLGFLSGASAGQLLGQVTLTGGPVLLAAVGGAPTEVTALFACLALFRAPYTLALGLVSALTGRLTRLVAARDRPSLLRVRRTLVAATLLLGVAAAIGAAWIGPALTELVFGDTVRLAAADTAVVAVGSVFALANLVLVVGALARDRAGGAAAVWLAAAPAGLAGYLLRGGTSLDRTCGAFLAVEVAAWVGFLAVEVRSDRLAGRQQDR